MYMYISVSKTSVSLTSGAGRKNLYSLSFSYFNKIGNSRPSPFLNKCYPCREKFAVVVILNFKIIKLEKEKKNRVRFSSTGGEEQSEGPR